MTFVIAGTGRSGTKWCATALRSVGIHAGHEQVHTTRMLVDLMEPRWPDGVDGDVSLAAVPYLETHFGQRVLVVRHPLAVASSIVTVGPLLAGSAPDGLLRRLDQDHPQVYDQPDELHAALCYWLLWNRRALRGAPRVLRIEGLTVDVLADAVGIAPRWTPIPGLPPVGQGPPPQQTPTWDDIDLGLRGAVAELAGVFGYDR